VPDVEVVHGGTVHTADRYVENDGRLLTNQASILSLELELLYATTVRRKLFGTSGVVSVYAKAYFTGSSIRPMVSPLLYSWSFRINIVWSSSDWHTRT